MTSIEETQSRSNSAEQSPEASPAQLLHRIPSYDKYGCTDIETQPYQTKGG